MGKSKKSNLGKTVNRTRRTIDKEIDKTTPKWRIFLSWSIIFFALMFAYNAIFDPEFRVMFMEPLFVQEVIIGLILFIPFSFLFVYILMKVNLWKK